MTQAIDKIRIEASLEYDLSVTNTRLSEEDQQDLISLAKIKLS